MRGAPPGPEKRARPQTNGFHVHAAPASLNRGSSTSGGGILCGQRRKGIVGPLSPEPGTGANNRAQVRSHRPREQPSTIAGPFGALKRN